MITLRDYQQKAVDAVMPVKKGIVVAPAGSGKTIIMASIIKELNPGRTLWLAHTTEQVEQGKAACEAVKVKTKVHHRCYAALPDAHGYDLILIDECHHAGSEQVRGILRGALVGTDFGCPVYGFTATPWREDGFDITQVLGPIVYTVTREAVADAGGVLPGKVRFVTIEQDGEIDHRLEEEARKRYTSKLQWVDRKNGNEEQRQRSLYAAALDVYVRRNRFRWGSVAGLASIYADKLAGCLMEPGTPASTIVLLDTKNECEQVAKMLNDEYQNDVAFALTSTSKGRSQIVEDFKSGKIRFVCCTSLADEGFDAPCAELLILASTGKAAGKAIQRTGRVMRPYEGKTHGMVIDVVDKHFFFRSQAKKRLAIYKDIGYEIEK
jgi:superfamily II DNA or RNA helicase